MSDEIDLLSDCHLQGQGRQERDVFKLDDVLEASFLNDEEMSVAVAVRGQYEEMEVEVKVEGEGDLKVPSEGEMLTSPLLSDAKADTSVGVEGSVKVEIVDHDLEHDCDVAAAKSLSRWDVISVGAFRQTQEAQREGVGVGHGHGHTPRSSVDLGKAMKSSPMSMLWQRTSAGGRRQRATIPGSIRKSLSGGSNGSGGNASASGSNGKHAKRRRLMMSAPTMSSPLVVSGSSSSVGGSHHSPSNNSGNSNSHSSSNNNNNKSKKEARRERKLLRRKGLGSVPAASGPLYSHQHSHSVSTYHHNNHPIHQYHQHQHHPNAKTRGVSSMQRLGSFGAGVSPLGP